MNTLPIQSIAPEPLDKVYILVSGKWYKALFWRVSDGRLVFTTDGITEITGCEWRYRD